jgi:hypothetical protein
MLTHVDGDVDTVNIIALNNDNKRQQFILSLSAGSTGARFTTGKQHLTTNHNKRQQFLHLLTKAKLGTQGPDRMA